MDRKSPPNRGENRGDRTAPGKRPGRPAFRPKKLVTKLARPAATTPVPPKKDAERIAKAMARAGLASRREAEEWIAAGRVSVNGTKITSPALNVTPKDKITVDGKDMRERERTRLFLYHKPRGLVTTHSDPQGRPTIFGAMPGNVPRLISVGRLDIGTEGLLLLTNDGGLARVLELPETGWLRRYRVRAHGKVTQPQLDALKDGVTIEGIRYGAIEASIEREQGANVWVTFAIREGKNREVKNVMGHLGLAVNRLIRVSFGPFQLAEIQEGAIEEVKTRVLREQLGERVIGLSGADFSAPILEHERHYAPNAEPLRGEMRKRDGSMRPERSPKVSVRQTGRDRDGKGATGNRAGAKPERFSHNAAREAVARHALHEETEERSKKRDAKHSLGTPQRVHRDPYARAKATDATAVADRKGRSVSVERVASQKSNRKEDRKGDRKSARDQERFGGPELARREKRGKRPYHGGPRDKKGH